MRKQWQTCWHLLSSPCSTTLFFLLKPLMIILNAQATMSLTWHLIPGSLDHYLSMFDQDLAIFYEDTGISRHKQVPDEQVKCVFCLSDIEEGEVVVKLRCGHLFHRSCLDKWIKHRRANCPLCRSSLVYLEAKERLEEEVEDDDAEDSADPPLLALILHSSEWWGRCLLLVVQVFVDGLKL